MSDDAQLVRAEEIPRQEAQLAITGGGGAAELVRYALEKGADVGVMERMLALHRQMKADDAKEAFDRSMAELQRNMPTIVKTKAGAKNAYVYAPLEEIIHQVKHLISDHGFSYTINSEIPPDQKAAVVKAIVTVTHAAGHSKPSEFTVPIDTQNPMMTAPQRYGGAMTFAKRYAFCNAFGIMTADVDLDGRNPTEPKARKFGPQRPAGETRQEPQGQRASAPPASQTPPAAASTPQAPTATADSPEAKKIRGAIWELAKSRFADGTELQQFLWDEGVLLDTETLQGVAPARLAQILEALKQRWQ